MSELGKQKQYIRDYVTVLDEYDVAKICNKINAVRLKDFGFPVEISSRGHHTNVFNLGAIDLKLMESDDLKAILARCNQMVVAKWDTIENYRLYDKHWFTADKLHVRDDFTFVVYSDMINPGNIESLITDILGLESTHIPEPSYEDRQSWEVTTPLMTLKRYKNGNIKIKGLTAEQWTVVSDKMKFMNIRRQRTV